MTSDGQLFTWGEGFGGKLGHGDQMCRTHPTFVSALAGGRVLEAACGVWHTAAIVLEGDAMAAAAVALEGVAGGAGGGGPRLEASAPDVLMHAASTAGAAALDGGLPATPSSRAHHARNSSASSALSDASLFHEGAGGALYTWGGVSESVVFGGEGEAKEKRDSNKARRGVLTAFLSHMLLPQLAVW